MKVFVDYLESPLGLLKIRSDDSCIKSIDFVLEKNELPQINSITEACKNQLLDYFEDASFQFSLPLCPQGTDFQKSVWESLTKISPGKTISYLALAQTLGDVKKTRAVGMANSKNPIPILIPCHRVIGKNNNLIGYSGGLWRKQWLLDHESKNNLPLQQSILF